MIPLLLKAGAFLLENLKTVLIAVAAAVILYFIVGFFNLRGELRERTAELKASQEKVTQLEKDVADIRTEHDALSKETVELQKKTQDLTAQLERRGKKSISELAEVHPKLVEKAINNGTAKTLKCIEIVSAGGEC